MEAFALLGFGAALVPLGLILLVIVAITGGRNEPDPDAERPAALYYAGVLFITVFIVLFSIFGIASSLLNLTTDTSGGGAFFDDESGQSFSSNAEDDEDWATAVRALLVGGVAAGLYAFHEPRRRRRAGGAVSARVRRTYTYAVSFVSVVVALISAIVALFALFEIIAPGVAGADGTRGESAVELFQALILAALAAGLALWHLRESEPGAAAIGISPVVPPEPPGPPPVDLEPASAPRKKRTTPLKAR